MADFKLAMMGLQSKPVSSSNSSSKAAFQVVLSLLCSKCCVASVFGRGRYNVTINFFHQRETPREFCKKILITIQLAPLLQVFFT